VGRVLLADDDASLLEVLALAFEDAGHSVLRASTGVAALAKIRSEHPSLVVSDINMPGLDGFALCKRLREAGNRVPVLLLTSRDTEIDEALGLELGADDYVTKPFSTRVLLARVAALLRREEARASEARAPSVIRVGLLALDADRLEVAWSDRVIETTVTEFRVVEALARRPGVVMSRAQLLEIVRGDDSVVDARIIDTYVRRLRRKLEAVDASFGAIETVIGAGYRWRDRDD
jgi:DNA-binding response OmpR family regulator